MVSFNNTKPFDIYAERFLKAISALGLSDYKVWNSLSSLSKGTMSKIRTGRTGVSKKVLTEFLIAYPKVSSSWLLTGKGEILIPTDDKGNLIADNGAVAISGDKATVHLSSSNSSEEIQLLQQRIKNLEELLAEKERIIQILERITSPQ